MKIMNIINKAEGITKSNSCPVLQTDTPASLLPTDWFPGCCVPSSGIAGALTDLWVPAAPLNVKVGTYRQHSYAPRFVGEWMGRGCGA